MGTSSLITRLFSRPFSRQRKKHAWQIALIAESPLRALDPRAKLALSLSCSLVVMLPLERLAFFLAAYFIILLWARLMSSFLQQLWRLKWVLVILFLLDWWIVDLSLAILVSLRLILLAGAFNLFFRTTTLGELRLALEKLGLPYSLAFSLGLAFQSLSFFDEEWQAIREAQQSRGISLSPKNFRELVQQIGDFVALTVPAIVLTTRRAWAMTESAYARGFDSPLRTPYFQIKLRGVDWLVIVLSFCIPIALYWRW